MDKSACALWLALESTANCENHHGSYLLLRLMRQQLEATVVNGIEAEWALANAKNDALVEQVAAAGLTAAGNAVYFNNHAAALKAFKDRKTSGMNLSKRVWNLTQQYKTELEMGLDIGIREGLSAQEMSRQMKQYLKYPDKLFRRVRDEHGVLQLSKAAAAFHPGRGVYRSSHMNALRLTGTETNMAYRTADHERIQDLDFVVGIRVVMSNNHTIKGPKGLPIPLTDICDELSAPMGSTATKGRGCYPKDFKFTGWHPNCRCHTETILLTATEMNKRLLALRRGEAYNVKQSPDYVSTTPSEFNQWVESNADRIAKAYKTGKEPYFIRDNESIVKTAHKKAKILKSRQIQYDTLTRNQCYTNVQFNEDNGGLIATHIEHNFNSRGGEYEKIAQKAGFNNGDAVILGPERHDEYRLKKCEGTWNELLFEVAGAENGTSGNIRNALKHCASKPNCKIAVVVFPNDFSMEEIERGIARYNGLKGEQQYVNFLSIKFVDKNSKIVYER